MSEDILTMQMESETEISRALELTIEQLKLVTLDPYRWKWVVMGIHNALQSAMVVAVMGSAQIGAAPQKQQEEWLRQHYRGNVSESPDRIEYFKVLLERVQSTDYIRGFVHSQPLSATTDQLDAVEALHAYRNTFMHYVPMGLWVGVRDFPKMAGQCLAVLEFICFKTGHVFATHPELAEQTNKQIEELRSINFDVESYYSELERRE